MAVSAGTHLGSYEILAPLGAGGMGEVYRARDTTLGREVAVKVLPEDFARDEDRVARFEREARVLASLNHPHIATLHGFEQEAETRFLVMELAKGDDLATRLKRGPLPLREALPLFLHVAEGLEAAHEKGVIHRDLKPANIKISDEGTVKILDFGLAKAMLPPTEIAEGDLSHSPTQSATRLGEILGTAGYMSPEQARGRPVDRRTDVWSFGCVMYEALTGCRAFRGETTTDTIAAVLEREPDWTKLPATTGVRLRELLRRCLQKDPRDRRRDMGDVRLDLEALLAEPGGAGAETVEAPTRGWNTSRLVLVGIGGLVGGGVLSAYFVWNLRPTPPAAAPARFGITLPSEHRLIHSGRILVALSPDGRHLVYAANQQIYLRALNAMDVVPIRGTQGGGRAPFFSPDGQWVGFWAEGQLRKVSVDGGTPVALCDAQNPYGADWGPDDAILFGQGPEGILRVSANGGLPELVIPMDSTKGEMSYGPQMLPGGDAVLFTLRTGGGSWDKAQIVAQVPGTSERRVLIEGGADARYAPSGHLIYVLGRTLVAVPFDPTRLEVTGGPVPIVEGVMRSTSQAGAAHFSFSATGALVFVPEETRRLVWVDREGAVETWATPPRHYSAPRLSPGGDRLAVLIEGDVWIHDISRGTSTRLTFTGDNNYPIWSPDGRRTIFSSGRSGPDNVFWKPADGSGEATRLTTGTTDQHPESISPDGRVLCWHEHHPTTNTDLWFASVDGTLEPRPFLQTPFEEEWAAFSPDGRWLAYVSGESGRYEVYARPFPGPGEKVQISAEGGTGPVWARSGRELFYRQDDALMAIDVRLGPVLEVGRPRLVFEGLDAALFPTSYSVTADGRRFVTTRASEEQPTRLNVILNWFEEVKRLAPAHE